TTRRPVRFTNRGSKSGISAYLRCAAGAGTKKAREALPPGPFSFRLVFRLLDGARLRCTCTNGAGAMGRGATATTGAHLGKHPLTSTPFEASGQVVRYGVSR